MRLERRKVALSSEQSVSVVVGMPDSSKRCDTAVVLAHGAGNDMTNPLLSAVHEGLCERGFTTLKFNFPYKERGGKAPDKTAVLEACYRKVLEELRHDATLAVRRIVIGGKSMGGRMATHLAAQGEKTAGLLLLGYPLHPAGKPEQLRDAHLGKIEVPMLIFAGTRDALCRLDLLQAALKPLAAPVRLHIVEGGDHSFNVPKSLHRSKDDVWEEMIEASAKWLRQL